MIDLCQYSDIFGKPKEGVHSLRFLNMAFVDLALTILGAYIIARYYSYNVLVVFGMLMIASVLIHRLFCVSTTLTNLVFKNILV